MSIYRTLIVHNVPSYKNSSGEPDCPQDNQALQASTELRFGTDLSIVFI